MSTLGYTLLTLGEESKELSSLEFFTGGIMGATDKKGVTTIVHGEYTFLLTENSLAYRYKPTGARVSKPRKVVKSFADLEKVTALLQTTGAKEVAATKNTTAQSAKEETVMAKLNMNGTQIEIPTEVHNVLKKAGVRGSTVELADLENAIEKATGADAEKLTAFQEKAFAEYQAANAPKQEDQAAEQTTETGGAGAAEQEQQPAGGGAGPGTSEIFNQQRTPQGGNTGAPANTPSNRSTKTPEERAAERKARLAEEQNELTQQTGQIEELYKQTGEIDDGNEALQSLRKLVLFKGSIPTFRTLVGSDTRLKADTINHVAPKDRKYHPNLRGKPTSTETGADIKLKYSELDLSLRLIESNPSQPSGIFIFVPETIINFSVQKLSQHSEREMLIAALAEFDENTERVIKFLNKEEAILLSTLLEAPFRIYDNKLKKYNETAPTISAVPRLSAQSGSYVFSLTARTATGSPTKLSIRYFIPLATHLVTKIGSESYDEALLSQALFGRLLFTESDHTMANKFSQLRPESAKLFTKREDGTHVYNAFTNIQSVPAYDSNKDREHNVEMPLPLVDWSKPTTAGAPPRPVFKKARHNEAGYDHKYVQDRDAVGSQINKQKKQTNKSRITENSSAIARLTAINKLFRGQQIPVK